MILDDTVGSAESETSSLADWLGGVEGIEDTLRIAQAGAAIGELNNHVFRVARYGNLQASATDFLQSVDCIFDDLNKCLHELVGVAEDARH